MNAGDHWKGSRDCSEWSYFKDGYDKATEDCEKKRCQNCEYLTYRWRGPIKEKRCSLLHIKVYDMMSCEEHKEK